MVYLSEVESIKERGLCASCVHAKEYRNDRGSVFLYCRKSEGDPRFPKYPPLPVLACAGHQPISAR